MTRLVRVSTSYPVVLNMQYCLYAKMAILDTVSPNTFMTEMTQYEQKQNVFEVL